jgi:hypothetical protein
MKFVNDGLQLKSIGLKFDPHRFDTKPNLHCLNQNVLIFSETVHDKKNGTQHKI